MEKQKKWQLVLILVVMGLTLYNILPTIFYYSKPLDKPVDEKVAEEAASSIRGRVDALENEGKEWIESFTHLLEIKAKSIELDKKDAQYYLVTFEKEKEAARFKKFLPRAGAMISFVPAQLSIGADIEQHGPNTVVVQRNVSVDMSNPQAKDWFSYSPLITKDGDVAPKYYTWVKDRLIPLVTAIGGESLWGKQAEAIVENKADERYDDLLLGLAKEVNGLNRSVGFDHPAMKGQAKSLTRSERPDREKIVPELLARAELLVSNLEKKEEQLKAKVKNAETGEVSFSSASSESLAVLRTEISQLKSFASLLKDKPQMFISKESPLTEKQAGILIDKGFKELGESKEQKIELGGQNPFFDTVLVDWEMGSIDLVLRPEVQRLISQDAKGELEAIYKEKLGQMLFNEVAYLSRLTDEDIKVDGEKINIRISPLLGTTGFLQLDLGEVALKQLEQIKAQTGSTWSPIHSDFQEDVYPQMTFNEFQKLPANQQKLGLVFYAPGADAKEAPKGFRTSSIYVVAKGVQKMLGSLQNLSKEGTSGQEWMEDFEKLKASLQQRGFIGYPGNLYGIDSAFKDDFIFELNDYYSYLINATRENFLTLGSKRFSVLPMSDVEQRILMENTIGDQIQENLLQWREDYQTAQVDLNPISRYSVPAPTQNPFISNLKLSFAKYFRGDDKKVLNWGLDLSGGKAVRIALFDHSGNAVTNPDDIRQAVDELYTRINKLGVSERTIRIEDSNILLEFPGSQGLSASELVKASSMTFNIVNEKFSQQNPTLSDATDRFLQEVWNEAVVTNQKDIDSIQKIAWQRLGGDAEEETAVNPRSEYASLLYSHGLRLASPEDRQVSSQFNDTVSAIARYRGDDHSEWNGQTHPLLVIFKNYALEGASLTNVHVAYDPNEGNTLTFDIKNSYDAAGRIGNPQEELYAWTSTFSEESIEGTQLDKYSSGRGWRMAVVLNDQVISSPSLKGALKDHASITGRFSQREINQLAADLKAGSLSFTPKILSEHNISPDLGKEERAKGIGASVIALVLVVLVMVGYYRFAGVVASFAVIMNLLIMWGVLQNIDAALTLAGIAGIVLTIGMAVDANVLVFERIKEEFKVSGRIASAIHTGYRKAFSAIVDSNITTIIAALILLQFDSGPIKGFAVTLIIGILSSMFTALFMTRYFFAGWVQKGKKQLTMSSWFGNTGINFLSKSRLAIIVSLVVIFMGTFLFVQERRTIFGMDFTGGYALTLEVMDKEGDNPRLDTYQALIQEGAPALDVEVKELTNSSLLRIQLGRGMEEEGAPFYEMPQEAKVQGAIYEFQHNPRLSWVVASLAANGIDISNSELDKLPSNWTAMSGQFSDAMQKNASLALLFALGAILVYITLRFQFKYALSAVIGLVHDVLLTLGVLAFFHWAGFAVQIDLVVIGAIMTIIGYSLNDTIIVFDRIREDLVLMRKSSFADVINHSINVTLSRTMMTSGTTLIVLLSLLLLGGSSIFAFSLVMALGIIFGTISSLFVAPAALWYMHKREESKRPNGAHLKLNNAS